jgi:DNA-binding transcriptional regulator of glucitol operon
MKLGSTIILCFVIAWVIQYTMTYFQMRRFNKRLNELKKIGITSVGMSGSVYKRRTYAVLVINKDEKILKAEQFSGWTVFAGLKPVVELEGLSTKDILDDTVTIAIPSKTRSAFKNAVQQIENAKKKAEEQGLQDNREQSAKNIPGEKQ